MWKMDNLKNKLKKCLSRSRFTFYADDPRTENNTLATMRHLYRNEAGVLILLFEKNNEIHVLLTQRSQDVRTHKGEPSFPGGGREPGDLNPADTALRETMEEIGLPKSYVEIVGNLVPVVTSSGYLLYPVIGLVRPEKFHDFVPINSSEVAETFSVPLINFVRRNDSYTGIKMATKYATVSKRFSVIHAFAHALPSGGTATIYGLTSYFCVLTACLVYNRLPEFSFPPYEKMRDLDDLFQIEENALLAVLGTASAYHKDIEEFNDSVKAKL